MRHADVELPSRAFPGAIDFVIPDLSKNALFSLKHPTGTKTDALAVDATSSTEYR